MPFDEYFLGTITIGPPRDRATSLIGRRTVWKQYLHYLVDEEDFHGIMDAAADLREIDAELKGLRIGK